MPIVRSGPRDVEQYIDVVGTLRRVLDADRPEQRREGLDALGNREGVPAELLRNPIDLVGPDEPALVLDVDAPGALEFRNQRVRYPRGFIQYLVGGQVRPDPLLHAVFQVADHEFRRGVDGNSQVFQQIGAKALRVPKRQDPRLGMESVGLERRVQRIRRVPLLRVAVRRKKIRVSEIGDGLLERRFLLPRLVVFAQLVEGLATRLFRIVGRRRSVGDIEDSVDEVSGSGRLENSDAI